MQKIYIILLTIGSLYACSSPVENTEKEQVQEQTQKAQPVAISLEETIDQEVVELKEKQNVKYKAFKIDGELPALFTAIYLEEGNYFQTIVEASASMAKLKASAFYKEGSLLFIEVKEEQFAYNVETDQVNYEQTTTIFEGRYYFDKASLLSKEEKGESQLIGAKDKASHLKSLFKEYRGKLN